MSEPKPDGEVGPAELILGATNFQLAEGVTGGYVRMTMHVTTETDIIATAPDAQAGLERLRPGPVLLVHVDAVGGLLAALSHAHNAYRTAKHDAREEQQRKASLN